MISERAIHLDLLAQVADSEHEAREVRRILGAAANDAIARKLARMGCTGACNGNQGRRECPSPQACQMPDEEGDALGIWRGAMIGLAITLGLVLGALALVWALT